MTQRNFKNFNCISTRLDSGQKVRDSFNDVNYNFLSKYVGEKVFKEMGVRAFGPQQAQALAPPFLWKSLLLSNSWWESAKHIIIINLLFLFQKSKISMRFEIQWEILSFLCANQSLPFNHCFKSHQISILSNKFTFHIWVYFKNAS